MKKLEAQAKLKTLLKDYFLGMKSPIAWCTSAGPAEILRALGFDVYFPENHGAMLGASRLAQKYIPKAHQAGYGGEICSYLTSDIGAWLSRETPLTQAYGIDSIPKPDMIVYNTNQCREVAEWFGFYGREYDCPVVGVNPPRHLETVTNADVKNVVAQFENVIAVGEKVIGSKLDLSRLSETVALSYKGSCLWKQLLETARCTPSPLSFFDGTILMAPIVMLRGTQQCVDFYEEALAEVNESIKEQDSNAVENRVRIFWEGMPIWGRLRTMAKFFEDYNAEVVASTYCNSWVFDDFNPEKPLESMAFAYTQIFINRGENAKLDYLKQMVDEFAIDGMIFHDAKTCFNNSNNRFGLPRRLQQESDLPVITIDGDLNDLRFFSDGQTNTKLETFIEQLISHKR